jgi:prepilin-type N-terminal cleavage/methylation domain-containing protein
MQSQDPNTHPKKRHARRARSAFTFIEVLVVMTMMGLMIAIATQPVREALRGEERRAAKQKVAAVLQKTRAAAVRRGSSAFFVRSGNVIRVYVDSARTLVQVGGPIDLYQQHKVTIAATPRDTVEFDPRGFAKGITTTERLIVVRDGRPDTVCIKGMGAIATRGCA